MHLDIALIVQIVNIGHRAAIDVRLLLLPPLLLRL